MTRNHIALISLMTQTLYTFAPPCREAPGRAIREVDFDLRILAVLAPFARSQYQGRAREQVIGLWSCLGLFTTLLKAAG